MIGPPGSGKSTVSSLLARTVGGLAVGETPSQMMYTEDAFNDPKRYATLSQVEFMLDKARVELNDEDGIVWEEDDTRYLHHVWTRALLSVGRIDSRAADLLERLATILDATCPKPAGIIALELDLSTLEHRIATRGRGFEAMAGRLDDPFYTLLATLHREHRNYVTSMLANGTPLWSIDASRPPDAILTDVLEHLDTNATLPAMSRDTGLSTADGLGAE